MLKAFKFRLYPSKPQRRLLESTLETARHWYNDCLAQRKAAYELVGWSVPYAYQLRQVKTRKAENPFAAGVHSHVLQLVCTDLERAFAAFFRRVKAGEKPRGYPRFKGRTRFASFGFKEYGNGFKLDGRRLKVTGVGRIAVRWHRALPSPPKTLRLVQQAGDWYAVLVCETEPVVQEPTGREVGIDVGIHSLIATSDGHCEANPGWYRAGQRQLRVAHRRVARRTKGGANRRRAVRSLQRVTAHTQAQRRDFLNKLAAGLVERYDWLALEGLHIRHMVRNHHLSKSILDSGWGYLLNRLSCKAEEAGRHVVLVDPRNTSQECSRCGLLQKLTLKDRWFNCGACGLRLDRDVNAARNILLRSRPGQGRWALTADPYCFLWEPARRAVAQEAVGL
jgi:putative transposase